MSGSSIEFFSTYRLLNDYFLCHQNLAQQALMGTINTSMQAVQQAQADLGEVDNLPPLGHDMVRNYTETKKNCFLKGKVYLWHWCKNNDCLYCCKPHIV